MDKELVPFKFQPKEVPHISALPNWVIEKIFHRLFVIDRLRCEPVSRQWHAILWAFGWKAQKELSGEIVFRGVNAQRSKFTHESLAALFLRVGADLTNLNLPSFNRKLRELIVPPPITSNIGGSLRLLSNLTELNIFRFELKDIVDFLPHTIRVIISSGTFDEQTLTTLSEKCPNLEDITFGYDHSVENVSKLSVTNMNSFLEKYPRLKRLQLSCEFDTDEQNDLTSIGTLKELEHFSLFTQLSEQAFRALIEGCQHLRSLNVESETPFSEETLCELAKLPELTTLAIKDRSGLTDAVVEAVAKRGILKAANVWGSHRLTDDSIIYLLDHCKLLEFINVNFCPWITESSLVAVMAELSDRDEESVKACNNNRGFFFGCRGTRIDFDRAVKATKNIPGLHLDTFGIGR